MGRGRRAAPPEGPVRKDEIPTLTHEQGGVGSVPPTGRFSCEDILMKTCCIYLRTPSHHPMTDQCSQELPRIVLLGKDGGIRIPEYI